MNKVEKIQDGIKSRVVCKRGDETILFEGITDHIIRCVVTRNDAPLDFSPLGIHRGPGVPFRIVNQSREGTVLLQTSKLQVKLTEDTGEMYWSLPAANGQERLLLHEGPKELMQTPLQVWNTGGEAPVIRRVRTVDGDRNFVENLKPVTDHMAWRGKLNFCWDETEQIHGLGQGEEGIYNYRGHTQYLYQHNMRIPVPFFCSDKGYAILVDCGCLMTFNDDERGSYLYLDNVEQMDYYFIAGAKPADLIGGFRYLTGKASMLPKWAFGYVQSKERYESQEELVQIAREYRRRGVGLDVVVQDWKTWVGDRWGEKQTDPARFPDLGSMRRQLHDMHVHSMVSVWPNMNYDTKDCAQMQEAGYLLHDLATYDAFSPEGCRLYWQQAYEGLYREGFDSWWCDSTEPFSGPDWGGEVQREPWERFRLVGEEHKKFLGAQRANLYALAHARGMFENQRACDPAHRMLNLTRSGYAGIQKYGAMLWSGDTAASWETLRRQITEGLNMALSGIPYWTLDAGAFFVVKENWQKRGCGCHEDPTPKWFWRGDFEEGLADQGYRELYVRWLQMAAFLPMMRSHGTDVPREIWHFGTAGEPVYDALTDAIALRYRLMPYIYSLAGDVVVNDSLMLRPLLYDFPEDPRAAGAHDSFMFGPSLLVCPVTKPMYYLPGGQVMRASASAGEDAAGDSGLPNEVFLAGRSWRCYLPGGTDWYDFTTGRRYEGGREVEVPAGIDRIPVFVKAGSILPMEEKLTYAQEEAATPLQIRVYPGADGAFAWYEDAGDGYAYEAGDYNLIPMHWEDQTRTLTIGSSGRRFPGGLTGRSCRLICGEACRDFVYDGQKMQITL